MALINIDVEALRSEKAALENRLNELTQLNGNLAALITRMGDSWDGESSEAFVQLMLRYSKQAAEMEKVFSEFSMYIQTVADRFEAVDKEGAAQLYNCF